MTSSDEIVRIVETAEILAFPRGAKSSDGSPSSGGDAPPREPPEEPPEPPPPSDDDGDDGDGSVIDRLNSEFAFVLIGSRAIVIRTQPEAPPEDRLRMLSLDAFKAYMHNRGASVPRRKRQDDGTWETVRVFVKLGPYWLGHKERLTYVGIEFWPNPDEVEGTPGYINLYRGFSIAPDRVTPKAERWKRYKIFRDHLINNICLGDTIHFDWIWHWLAHLLQRPRERVGTAIVLRGLQGVGKSTIGDVIGKMIAAHYFLVDDQRYVIGNFNAHMASCLLLQVDEGVWAGDKGAEGRLKGLVTAPKQMIEAKGVDPIRLNNYVRLIFTSNSDWVVPAGMDERRFAVFDVGAGVKENHGYFAEMWKELESGGLEALLADLLDCELDAPGSPNLRSIPRTEALLEQKIRSLDPIAAWWLARLENGTQTHRAAAWRARVPIVTLFNDYLRSTERIGVRRKAAETEFGIRMKRLLPNMARVKSLEEVEAIGEDGRPLVQSKRVYCWVFPPLAECRAAFEAQIGQSYQWGDDDGSPPAGDGSMEADTAL
ncbi:hypothetical protein A1351_20210 [Methylosinus sp. R-45379]|uniref:primase-helicase family protein n=1 Tax=Methylosinus sp. R-45379 TaxID=980563 RepID=UPI0007C88E3C|nr:primase-helicase family protein [Methylosinus sp. R-45379]OAI22894.1 hypothetical protein A1351_20210 [Methylosinus sp. R-45379]